MRAEGIYLGLICEAECCLQCSWDSEIEVLKTRCGNGILRLLGLVSNESLSFHGQFRQHNNGIEKVVPSFSNWDSKSINQSINQSININIYSWYLK